MLVAETIAKVGRLHFVQGLVIKAICRGLGLSRMVLRSGATKFRYANSLAPCAHRYSVNNQRHMAGLTGQLTRRSDRLLPGRGICLCCGAMILRPPTSMALEAMLDAIPNERQVTLNWLLERLGDRSFGVVLLLLAILGLLPGVSALAGLLLMVPAMQMILARGRPIFPRRVGDRHFEGRSLAKMVRRAVPVIRWLERFIRPRWYTPFEATKRVVGGIVLLLGACLLAPVPLSNVLPALVITLIAFAYLEEDGLLLCAALLAALSILATTGIVIWETASAAGWVPGLL